jgi:putative colanic acid biosynthesis acetyltransferase WcaF
MSRVRNDLFDPHQGLDRGAPLWKECCWQLVKGCFFLTWFPWPMALKRGLLRLFGAKVGLGVVIKPRVHIYFPWKFQIGDHAWLGEEAFIMNLEPVHIGPNCCISQRAFLCTGNHDFTDPAFRFMNKGIVVHAGAWIAASVFVGPGVEVGSDAVATAGSVVLRDLPAGMVCSGNPCTPVKPRWNELEKVVPMRRAAAA